MFLFTFFFNSLAWMQHFVNNQIFQPSVLASHPACWFNDLPQRPTQPFLLFCFYHWGRLSLFGCININPFRNRYEFYCICSRSDIGQDEGRGGGNSRSWDGCHMWLTLHPLMLVHTTDLQYRRLPATHHSDRHLLTHTDMSAWDYASNK